MKITVLQVGADDHIPHASNREYNTKSPIEARKIWKCHNRGPAISETPTISGANATMNMTIKDIR